MLRCTHLSFTIHCMAITSLYLLKANSFPLVGIPNGETGSKLGTVDISSMSKEAILGKMVLPDDTQQAKDTKSVIAQYIFSLVQQDGLKKTTPMTSATEIETEAVTLAETEAPEITTRQTTTIKTTPKPVPTERVTERLSTTERTTTEPEPEYEEEIEMRRPNSKEEATDAIQDIINAAIFQAQEQATTTTTTTPPPTTMRRRRTRSTTLRNPSTSTTEISEYYDEDTEEATTLRRRTYRPNRRTTKNPDSGVTGWVPEEDDEEGDMTRPTPASVNNGNVLTDITKLLVNVGTANVSGIVDQSLKIASVETVGSVISGVFNLFNCTPLDQLVGRCKQQRDGGQTNHNP